MNKKTKLSWLDDTTIDEQVKKAIVSATPAERLTWMAIGAIVTLVTAVVLQIVF